MTDVSSVVSFIVSPLGWPWWLCIGLGGIGRRVAAMAHHGFGMRVIGVGRRRPADLAKALGLPPGLGLGGM